MTSDRPKAYSYLRFSTPDQMQGDSRRRQMDLARNYAHRQGLELDEELTFHDLGVSAFRGRNAQAGELAAFKRAVEEGFVEQGSYLLIENLDRLSRNKARKAARELESIVESGVAVVTLNDEKVYTEEALDDDPFAFIMVVMTFMRAHEESQAKSRRLHAAWDNKRSQAGNGRALTAQCPYWLEVDPETREFRVHEERAEVVRKVYQWALESVGQETIARRLNEQGYQTFGRAEHWRRSYVAKLLDNPAVVGTYQPFELVYEGSKRQRKPKGDPVPGHYPAVVDEETYSAVQAMRRTNGAAARGRQAGKDCKNILARLATCPLCASSMQRVSKGSGRKGGLAYLVCSRAKSGGGCQYRGVKMRDVEQALAEQAVEIREGLATDKGTGREIEQELVGVDEEIDQIAAARDRLIEAIEKGTESTGMRDRLAQKEQHLEQLQERQRQLREQWATIDPERVTKQRDDLARALLAYEWERNEVNRLARQVAQSVTIDYTTGTMQWYWHAGGSTGLRLEPGAAGFGFANEA